MLREYLCINCNNFYTMLFLYFCKLCIELQGVFLNPSCVLPCPSLWSTRIYKALKIKINSSHLKAVLNFWALLFKEEADIVVWAQPSQVLSGAMIILTPKKERRVHNTPGSFSSLLPSLSSCPHPASLAQSCCFLFTADYLARSAGYCFHSGVWLCCQEGWAHKDKVAGFCICSCFASFWDFSTKDNWWCPGFDAALGLVETAERALPDCSPAH